MIDRHKEFNRDVMFAGGAWMWSGFAPANKFSLSVTQTALKACEAKGIDKILMTMWGDDGAEWLGLACCLRCPGWENTLTAAINTPRPFTL